MCAPGGVQHPSSPTRPGVHRLHQFAQRWVWDTESLYFCMATSRSAWAPFARSVKILRVRRSSATSCFSPLPTKPRPRKVPAVHQCGSSPPGSVELNAGGRGRAVKQLKVKSPNLFVGIAWSDVRALLSTVAGAARCSLAGGWADEFLSGPG
ncbi:hypothetical protein R1flu_017698 [Riccia fluitans]|uniref:Uncharacterized protein n=1 Tax=Riccia fluitans TaxID=41844 RepID=A0ABD1ZDZ8_9MARC